MDLLKKLIGAYLIGIALVVAIFFIINAFLSDAVEVSDVWYALDILMIIGLVPALALNYAAKREAGGIGPGEPVSRRYLEVNVVFFATAGVTILFLHSWFSILAHGADSLDGNHQAWVIWAAVDTILPLVLGFTGCRLLQGESRR